MASFQIPKRLRAGLAEIASIKDEEFTQFLSGLENVEQAVRELQSGSPAADLLERIRQERFVEA